MASRRASSAASAAGHHFDVADKLLRGSRVTQTSYRRHGTGKTGPCGYREQTEGGCLAARRYASRAYSPGSLLKVRVDEIKTLRANLKQARHDHQTLELQVRELRSTDTSTKVRPPCLFRSACRQCSRTPQFKLDSLQQQLKLAKDEAERSSAELASKSEEFAKYRRSQHAEFVQLQAAHDALAQNHATTESTLRALQSTHNAQTSQLTQALSRIQDLSGQLAEQEATYSSEAANLRRLVQMMEDREKEAKSIVDSIEAQWAEVGERADRREAVLQEEIESQKERAEAAEKKVDELQEVMGRIERGEFPVPSTSAGSVPSTPARGVGSPMFGTSPSFTSPGMLGLSPTVAIASRVQKGGKTFTEVYADYVKLQEDYARKSAEYDQMAETLQRVLDELEQRVRPSVYAPWSVTDFIFAGSGAQPAA